MDSPFDSDEHDILEESSSPPPGIGVGLGWAASGSGGSAAEEGDSDDEDEDEDEEGPSVNISTNGGGLFDSHSHSLGIGHGGAEFSFDLNGSSITSTAPGAGQGSTSNAMEDEDGLGGLRDDDSLFDAEEEQVEQRAMDYLSTGIRPVPAELAAQVASAAAAAAEAGGGGGISDSPAVQGEWKGAGPYRPGVLGGEDDYEVAVSNGVGGQWAKRELEELGWDLTAAGAGAGMTLTAEEEEGPAEKKRKGSVTFSQQQQQFQAKGKQQQQEEHPLVTAEQAALGVQPPSALQYTLYELPLPSSLATSSSTSTSTSTTKEQTDRFERKKNAQKSAAQQAIEGSDNPVALWANPPPSSESGLRKTIKLLEEVVKSLPESEWQFSSSSSQSLAVYDPSPALNARRRTVGIGGKVRDLNGQAGDSIGGGTGRASWADNAEVVGGAEEGGDWRWEDVAVTGEQGGQRATTTWDFV